MGTSPTPCTASKLRSQQDRVLYAGCYRVECLPLPQLQRVSVVDSNVRFIMHLLGAHQDISAERHTESNLTWQHTGGNTARTQHSTDREPTRKSWAMAALLFRLNLKAGHEQNLHAAAHLLGRRRRSSSGSEDGRAHKRLALLNQPR